MKKSQVVIAAIVFLLFMASIADYGSTLTENILIRAARYFLFGAALIALLGFALYQMARDLGDPDSKWKSRAEAERDFLQTRREYGIDPYTPEEQKAMLAEEVAAYNERSRASAAMCGSSNWKDFQGEWHDFETLPEGPYYDDRSQEIKEIEELKAKNVEAYNEELINIGWRLSGARARKTRIWYE